MKNYPNGAPPKWKIYKYQGQFSGELVRYRFKGPGYSMSAYTYATFEEACEQAWKIWESDERDKLKNWKEVTE